MASNTISTNEVLPDSFGIIEHRQSCHRYVMNKYDSFLNNNLGVEISDEK